MQRIWRAALVLSSWCSGGPACTTPVPTGGGELEAPLRRGAPPDAPAVARPSPELEWLVRARALPSRGPLEVEVLSRAAMLEVALRQLDEGAPAHVFVERGQVLVALGLAPADFDLRAAIEQALSVALVGVYDPDGARVVVADDVRSEEVRRTRVHELAHALVDQHFDLGPRFGYRRDGADRAAVASTLAEGDASSVMIDWMSEESGEPRDEVRDRFLAGFDADETAPDGLPPVVRRLLAAPYVEGVALVDGLRARGGWGRVDEVWRSPPATSEQALHPDKYAVGELPSIALVPNRPEAGCRLVYSDVLGEQTWRAFLASWHGAPLARQLSRGWNGDRAATFACRDGRWVVLQLAADDAEVASRWAWAIAAGLGRSRCSAPPRDASGLGLVVRVTLPPAPACAAVESSSP